MCGHSHSSSIMKAQIAREKKVKKEKWMVSFRRRRLVVETLGEWIRGVGRRGKYQRVGMIEWPMRSLSK